MDRANIDEIISRIFFDLIIWKLFNALGPIVRIKRKKTIPINVKIGLGNVLLSADKYVEPKTI
jgi:hypothetical protein